MNSNANNYDATVRAESALDEESFLEAYSKTEYPKPAATADIAVFRRAENGFEVLLIRRGNHPFKGCWALPGGFVDPGEDVIDAAARELEEETGIEGLNLELFGIYGAPGRDPRGWTVSGGYCTLLDDADDSRASAMRAGDDADDARWCPIVVRRDATEGGVRMVELEIAGCPGATPIVRFETVEQRFGSPRARVVHGEGFAFDHAQLLADAYIMACLGN